MAYDLEEQEQLDQIKAFWAKWGNLITSAATAVALAFAAYYGYQYYQRSQAIEAAPLYEQLEKISTNVKSDPKNAQLVTDLTTSLTTKYAGTAYAQMGAMLGAKAQSELGKQDAANELLKWAMDNAKNEEYRHIARARLATALIDAKKPAEALALITDPAPKGFETMFLDRKGDAQVALGKKDMAIDAYKKAWTAAVQNANIKDVLEQKLSMLGADVHEAKVTAN